MPGEGTGTRVSRVVGAVQGYGPAPHAPLGIACYSPHFSVWRFPPKTQALAAAGPARTGDTAGRGGRRAADRVSSPGMQGRVRRAHRSHILSFQLVLRSDLQTPVGDEPHGPQVASLTPHAPDTKPGFDAPSHCVSAPPRTVALIGRAGMFQPIAVRPSVTWTSPSTAPGGNLLFSPRQK